MVAPRELVRQWSQVGHEGLLAGAVPHQRTGTPAKPGTTARSWGTDSALSDHEGMNGALCCAGPLGPGGREEQGPRGG